MEVEEIDAACKRAIDDLWLQDTRKVGHGISIMGHVTTKGELIFTYEEVRFNDGTQDNDTVERGIILCAQFSEWIANKLEAGWKFSAA